MLMLPLPLLVAEAVAFFMILQRVGFLNTLAVYLLPCFLGFLIVTTVGRVALMNMQSSMTRGQMPAGKMLHSGAIFLSGLLFLVPSISTRIFGLVLLLPGLRHLALWRFKIYMAKKMASGASQGFGFSRGPFGGFGGGFGGAAGPGAGAGGFRYYEFRNDGTGFKDFSEERESRDAEVLDVTPLEITHEKKNNPEGQG